MLRLSRARTPSAQMACPRDGVLLARRGYIFARPLSQAAAQPQFDFPLVRRELFEAWSRAEARTVSGRAARQATYCNFTYLDAERLYASNSVSWHWLDREMSSNFAGETGAVAIYHGALSAISLRAAFAPLPETARTFAAAHMEAEGQHLALLENTVPVSKRTRLLPAWRTAGWALGFLPTLVCGAPGLYRTVASVESFVEEHYQQQIIPLSKSGECPELVRLLTHCCADEVHHREDALKQLPPGAGGPVAWAWGALVKTGSRVAAELARRI
ncbi:ubiquinone biosynthesis protein COQ7-domain-containing protein [Pavlovales sp. CCMP2436]|nr:ubiquinone biosynthesis protein COQ7-domain-containing protein [Pavlovales sp. CCMP2436]